MTRILDKAEAAFAEKGSAVTLAEVAAYAAVDTALLRYYFGDKHQLFRSVFQRRAAIINELRLDAMAAYRRTAGSRMTLEGIIDAFTRPAFEKMHEDSGWRNYLSIVAYVNSSRGLLYELMAETYDRVSHELIEDMRRLLPGAAEEDVYWAYHFMTGAFTFSLGQTQRIDRLSGGRVSSKDAPAIAERFAILVAAGIREMCRRRPAGRARS